MKHGNWNLLISTALIYNEHQIMNPGRHVDYLAVALKMQSFGVEPCPEHWRYESAAIVAMYAWSQAL